MTTFSFILLLLFWIICSVITFGFTYAYEQRHWPTLAVSHESNSFWSLLVIALLCGPMALLGALMAGHYGEGFLYRRINRRRKGA